MTNFTLLDIIIDTPLYQVFLKYFVIINLHKHSFILSLFKKPVKILNLNELSKYLQRVMPARKI